MLEILNFSGLYFRFYVYYKIVKFFDEFKYDFVLEIGCIFEFSTYCVHILEFWINFWFLLRHLESPLATGRYDALWGALQRL